MGYYVSMARDTNAVQDIADAIHDTYACAVADAGDEALVPKLVTTLQRGVGYCQ